MNKRPSAFWRILAKVTGLLPALLLFKPRVLLAEGASRRLTRPCILMSNHTAFMDFPLYLVVFWPYRLRFLMAEVLYRTPVLRWLLDRLGGIKVDRSALNVGFVREACAALESGDVVGVFPQGRLPVKGQTFPYKPGILWIAAASKAPIVPVYTDGNYGLLRRTTVVIGAPFTPPESDDTEALCAMLAQKEEALAAIAERAKKK